MRCQFSTFIPLNAKKHYKLNSSVLTSSLSDKASSPSRVQLNCQAEVEEFVYNSLITTLLIIRFDWFELKLIPELTLGYYVDIPWHYDCAETSYISKKFSGAVCIY